MQRWDDGKTLPGCKPRYGGRGNKGGGSTALWWTRWPLGAWRAGLACPAGSLTFSSPCPWDSLRTRKAQLTQAPSGASRPSQPPSIECIPNVVPACSLPFLISSRKSVLPLGPSFLCVTRSITFNLHSRPGGRCYSPNLANEKRDSQVK